MTINTEILYWVGFGLSFLATFLFSMFYISLGSFSKISINRFLENKNKEFREHVLDIYEELKISTEIMRALCLIFFLICSALIFPSMNLRPLWLLLSALAFHILFFEFLPRLLNSLNNQKMLSFFLSSFRLPYVLTLPVIWMTKFRSTEKEPEEPREASEEEIDALIEEAEEEGIIEKEEGELLKSVVEFGDTIVREIMTPRVAMVCIPNSASIKSLRDLVIKEKHSRIPVYKERIDNIEGIIIAKDLLEYSADKFVEDSLDPLVRPVYFIPESMKVAELLKEFQKRKQKLAVVVDEHGGVSGLVTMEDLMEEIVGEIQDEYDEDEAQIIQDGDHYIVFGDAEVEDLEDLFGLDLAEDDYVTVGGLITHYLGRLPEKNETFRIKGLSIEILEVGRKRINKLRISAADPAEN